MAEVDKRTSLAMSNEMEMLTFYLSDGQLYGINVFKIIEILECPKRVTRIPQSHPNIKGQLDFRGHPTTLIDLSEFLGMAPVDFRNTVSYVVICEYSTSVHGFLVSQPNMLITKGWGEIIRPGGTVYDSSFLTAITYHNNQPIQILDVEKVLTEIVGIDIDISDPLLVRSKQLIRPDHHILAVDDSKAACALISATLDTMGVANTVVDQAPKALALLASTLDAQGKSPYTLIFTDIEMPVMDGFTFIRKVKSDARFKDIYLAVHSSLSNRSNQSKAKEMGADNFVSKFTADNIVTTVLDEIENADQAR